MLTRNEVVTRTSGVTRESKTTRIYTNVKNSPQTIALGDSVVYKAKCKAVSPVVSNLESHGKSTLLVTLKSLITTRVTDFLLPLNPLIFPPTILVLCQHISVWSVTDAD
jgi:hypothetical protein